MFETIKHFSFPRFSNNQKARLLHSEIILILALLITGFQGLIYFGTYSKIAVLGYAANISVSDVVNLTNIKRAENGVEELTVNEDLSAAAYKKALDMIENNYWSHVSPSGVEPWSFFNSAGYEYRYAGENLARDFSSSTSAVDAWMASPSHRDNLLSTKYQEIGIAVIEGDLNGADTTIIVQLFGTKTSPRVAAVPQVAANTDEVNIVEVPVVEAQELPEVETVEEIATVNKKVASPFITTRTVSLFVMGLLSIVLVIDIIEVERRKISRVSGRKFAHLAYLLTLIAILVISKAGEIL